jgi:alkanesulfonate monooxygenase SsuD/methylene tetrahydromethanopterin reductase-like flavin-dependent oxidoreductase (luciferase family)
VLDRATTCVASHTRRVAVGTSVLNVPWYNPMLLARRLSTLDVLSGGRLRVGLGMGWSPDEYEAAGVPWQDHGRRADECIRVLKTIWTTNPVEFQGTYYRIPKSMINLKPVQKPHPPIYMSRPAWQTCLGHLPFPENWTLGRQQYAGADPVYERRVASVHATSRKWAGRSQTKREDLRPSSGA